MDSPDALFAPDHLVQTPVPGPLYLLSCIRLPLETSYATDEHGLVANPAHAFQRNVIAYPDGSRFEARVSGSPLLGLPNIYDLDYLLGLGSLVDQGVVAPDGTFQDVSYRAILLASRPGSEMRVTGGKVNAVKRALGRWANTTVQTNMEMVFEREVEQVRSGETAPAPGTGRPRRRERDVTHWILEYDVESEVRANDSTDVIHLLRINPIWLGQTETGIAAWIDLEVHNSLRSAVAKGIYLRLVLAVAQGWRPARHSEILSSWLEVLGAQTSERPADVANRFRAALKELQGYGVVDQFEVASIRRGVYRVDLMPGRVVCDAAAARGIGALDPVRTRVLISQLGQYQIPAGEARALLRRHGMRVQEVLQRVHYVRTEKQGLDAKGKPIVAWHSWIGSALEQGWEFKEPEYERWARRRADRFELASLREQPESPAPPTTLLPTPPEPVTPSAPDFALPDDPWGTALAQIRPELAPMIFTTWFRETWMQEIAGDHVVVAVPNSFAREWISERYGARLETALSDALGRPVRLDLHIARPPSG
ncbi:MAG TPA: DnaA N-terminal domain-containing protein [Longimicrobiaceae bacterium]|nr:DnaA N-terminal domain-containing protein [Longimicrobiaceae bacterium]